MALAPKGRWAAATSVVPAPPGLHSWSKIPSPQSLLPREGGGYKEWEWDPGLADQVGKGQTVLLLAKDLRSFIHAVEHVITSPPIKMRFGRGKVILCAMRDRVAVIHRRSSPAQVLSLRENGVGH